MRHELAAHSVVVDGMTAETKAPWSCQKNLKKS